MDVTAALISFVTDPTAAFAAAEAKLTKALSSVPDHARGHMTLGYVDILTNRVAEGIAECEQALDLDRNLADAHAVIGLGKIFIGRAEETEAHIAEALRLSPRDTEAHTLDDDRGHGKLHLGSYEEAVAWFRRSIEINRNYPQPYFHWAPPLRSSVGWTRRVPPSTPASRSTRPSPLPASAPWTAMSDDPTFLAQLEPVSTACARPGFPSSDRRAQPRRDPRRRRRRLLAAHGRGRGGDGAGGQRAARGGDADRAVVRRAASSRRWATACCWNFPPSSRRSNARSRSRS